MATSSSDSPAADSVPTSPPHDLPLDPLLQPGSFIDPTQNGESEPQFTGDVPDLANDSTPPPSKGAEEAPERPSWLPDDWKMILKVRTSGATAGSTDRYYLPPDSKLGRFRSKKEVEYFLRTGTKRKKSESSAEPSEKPAAATGKRKSKTPAEPSEKSSAAASAKKKSKSASKKGDSKPPAFDPLKFDFENVPEMTTWKLKDAATNKWVPYIDGKKVPKSVRQEWSAAFEALATGKI